MYSYEIWFGGSCIINGLNANELFEDENEAEEVAKDAVVDRINDWKIDECYDGETEEDFNIEIIEV